MTARSIRQGVVSEESKDSGPFKLIKVVADGKTMDVTVLDFAGVSGSPLKGSPVLILCPDGDDGKAYGIAAGPPTGTRVDGQKPGELNLKNHKTGNVITHDDDGNTIVKTPSGSISKHYKNGDVGVQPAGGKNVFLGEVSGAGCHPVATSAGYSTNVFAKV